MNDLIDFAEKNKELLIAGAVWAANLILANVTEITPETPGWKRLLIKLSNWVAGNFSQRAGK